MRKRDFIVVAAAVVLSAGTLWGQVGSRGVVGGTRPATRGSGLLSGSSSTAMAAGTVQPAVPIVLAKTFKALATDPIERPEYNTKTKAIAKNLTSAIALVVMEDSSGEEIGATSDVIAAVAAGSRQNDPIGDVLSSISMLGGDANLVKTHPELQGLAEVLKDKTTGERDSMVRKTAEVLLADTNFVRSHAAQARLLRDKLAESAQSSFVMVKKQAAVGREMQTSFDEAVRAVGMRYPKIDPGKIEFSFGDKYTPHEGGSAGTCFAVMMLSVLEGFEIDQKCAVTGDITVDWKVRKVGGVAAKVRGATADKCLYVAVPAGNRENVADMALYYGDAGIREIQVFSLETLQDAVGLLRKDRSPQLTEAMKEYTELLPRLRGGKGTYGLASNQKVLENIVALAPNHESAKMMLEMGKGTFAKKLTPMFAMEIFAKNFVPYLMIFAQGRPITRQTVPQALTAATKKELSQLSGMCPAELMAVVKDMQGIVDMCENIAQGQTKQELLQPKLNTLRADLQKLELNKEFSEKLMRAGF